MNGLSDQRQKANEKMLEAMLEYAGACHVKSIAEELDEQYESSHQIPYPPELDIKLRKLISDYNRRIRMRKLCNTGRKLLIKVAVFFLIIILGISILAVGVEAFRLKLFNFMIKVQEQYTSVKMEDYNPLPNDPLNSLQNYEDAYIPTYVPKGFSIINAIVQDEIKVIVYTNSIGEEIIFNQYDDINTDLRIDTQIARTDRIFVNGVEGIFIEKDDMYTLVWHNNESIFTLTAKVDKNELIKMAESVEKNK